jgi:cytochrome c oxidase subunit II
VPQQVRYNLPIEIMYTVLPFVMIGVLFFFTARDENTIDRLSKNPDVVVNVTGFQWSWSFQYPQYSVNPTKSLCGNGDVCEIGQQWNGLIPGNRTSLPLLEIPVHETVRFNLVSADVIHSFWIIPFDFKRDVVPGHPNHFQVYTTATGDSIGRCSELCGLYHSRMLFRVHVVSKAQFNAWIHAQQAQQNASGGAS